MKKSLFYAFGLAAAAASLLYALVVLPWHLRWGADDEEVSRALPGDEIVPAPRMASTRAITIDAPPSRVWPWLVQIGHGRGGMYSYEWLENLAGCDLHNAEHIHPEWQDLQVGDLVRMGPEGYPFYIVRVLEAERTLVLQSGDPETGEPGTGSWTFFLQERPGGKTRLISRQRSDYEPGPANFVMWRVFVEPVSFLMEQKMLRGIRERAER